MSDDAEGRLHYDSTLPKIDKDGNQVLSNYIDPGEEQVNGATHDLLSDPDKTIAPEQSAGGAAFLTQDALIELEGDKHNVAPLGQTDGSPAEKITTDESVTHSQGAAAKEDGKTAPAGPESEGSFEAPKK